MTRQAGVSDAYWSTSAAFVDYDRDGEARSLRRQLRRFRASPPIKLCSDPVGARDYCGPRAYHPVPDRLYRNEGNGRFADVTERAGISKADGAGLGVATGDYNGDGWIDLYVANDATPNQLWINQHDGTFVDEGLLSGSAVNAHGNPEGSMGIASGDFDLDGDEDLFVTNIVAETSCCMSTTGAATSTMPGRGSGLARAHRGVHRVRHRLVRLRQRRLARSVRRQRRRQHRRGAARTAVAVPDAEPAVSQLGGAAVRGDERAPAGAAFARAEIGRGAAFGDIDNDGDVDIVVTNNNGPVRLLLNQAGRGQSLAGGARRRSARQPFRDRRLDRRRARRDGRRSGAASDRRQLSVGERRARAFRSRLVVRRRCRRRAVARRAA